MRGAKPGFETLIKARAPNMVTIGSDTCHDVHNVVKKLCGYFFSTYVEHLMDDIHNFKFSVDLQFHLKDICSVLDEPHLRPKQRIPHRWSTVKLGTYSWYPVHDSIEDLIRTRILFGLGYYLSIWVRAVS